MPWYLPRRACTYQRPDGQQVPIRFWLTSKRTQHRILGQGLVSHHPDEKVACKNLKLI